MRERVCFISPGALPLFTGAGVGFGGAEAQFFLLARELAKRSDFDVHVIAQGDSGPPTVHDGVTLHTVPLGSGIAGKLRLQRELARVDARTYLQRGIGSVTKEVAFFCRLRGRHFIYWVAAEQDVDPNIQGTGVGRARGFDWALRGADMVIVQSARQEKLLAQHFARTGHLLRNSFPARTPSAVPKSSVLWVGRLIPLKRPGLFVELARRNPAWQFVMIAPAASGDPFADEVYRTASRVTNLRVIPGVPFADSPRYFDEAALLVNTSTTEGFPNTFIQAMWAATPIASLAVDPDGMIANLGLGFAPTGDDFESFSSGVGALLNDRARLEAMGQRAYAHANANHALARNAATLAALIQACPHAPPGHGATAMP